MKINTKVLHGYPVIDKNTGAASIPKYQASTFHQNDYSKEQKYTYTRFNNPTVEAAEECIAFLENGKYGLAFSSGIAAINSVLLLLKKGDHIVLGKDIYGGTFQSITDMLSKFGIEYTLVDETISDDWETAVKENTKLFYIETPSNPTLKITNIKEVVAIANQHNILIACDNTFMTPYFQNPLQLGVDIVIHSATKFLNGHSDVVAGFLVVNDVELYNQLKNQQKMLGAILGVEDAWLLLRGVKTLAVRMEQSNTNAMRIVEFLKNKKTIKSLYYPGMDEHPGNKTHILQSTGGGAVLSFELECKEQVDYLFKHIQLPIVAVSLGGVESILSYPWNMSHACMPKIERLKMGVTDTLIRMSVGIEDIDDLLADLDNCIN